MDHQDLVERLLNRPDLACVIVEDGIEQLALDAGERGPYGLDRRRPSVAVEGELRIEVADRVYEVAKFRVEALQIVAERGAALRKACRERFSAPRDGERRVVWFVSLCHGLPSE